MCTHTIGAGRGGEGVHLCDPLPQLFFLAISAPKTSWCGWNGELGEQSVGTRASEPVPELLWFAVLALPLDKSSTVLSAVYGGAI